MNLYLDIETIPSQSPIVHARIAETVTAPGNYKKPETIAEWEREQKPALVKEAISRTALDGAFGHVCAIGWAWNNDEPQVAWIESVEQEKAILEDVLRTLDRNLVEEPWRTPTIVGHNVINFDIRFIWQRAIVLSIHVPHWFPRDPKPWSHEAFDTMTAFAGARGTIGMSRLCEALGLEGKGDIDGSKIGDLWAQGEFDAINAYCCADVERTRAIHRRMMVAFGEAA